MSFEKGRSGSQSSSGSTSSNSGQGQPQDQQRSSRRVRFPLDNNPQTRKIYYPNDEEGSPFHDEEDVPITQQQPSMRMVRNVSSRGGARNSSPLTSPPIVPEENEEDSYFVPRRPSNPNDSPTMFVTRPDNSQVDLNSEDEEDDETTESATDSTRRLISPPQEPNRLQQPEPVASVGPNSLQNLFDVGLHTSGGLAPGAVDHDEALHRQGAIDEEGPTVGDELKRRRDSVLRRIHSLREKHGTLSRSSSERSRHHPDEPSGPYGKGSNDGDVPLLELDQKLKKIQEENEDIDTNEMARKLVRSHTLHRHPAKDKSMSLDEKKAEDEKKKKEEEAYLVAADDFVTAQNEYDLYGYDGTEGDLPPPADGHYHHDHHEDYVAPPSKVRQGVLGSLLKLYGDADGDKSGNTTPGANSPSGRSTPTSEPGTPYITPAEGGTQVPEATASSTSKRPKLLHTSSASSLFTSSSSKNNKEKRPKWYEHKHSRSTSSLGGLVVGASQTLAAPGTNATEGVFKPSRPKFTKRSSGGIKKQKQKLKLEEQIRITVHIADVLQRQRFIIRMCRALMLYGAPTHRLEEYMRMTARVLEINGQFLYIPGCMVISFGDPTTHTTEMQLVRCVQGLNLSKLHKAHQIYKEVVHDVIGVEEASQRVDDLLAAKNQYPVWLTLIFFGLAAASVTPFAFGGYWPDIPISFVLGGLVGVLQLIVAPRSTCYSNVFEVTSSIVVSFLGRAIGSIERNGKQDVFCFASIAQGSLALILPGYIILCGSLELQSKNIVAGSVRMFYAIIYSLFLGFGITLGAAIYGWIDSNATSKTDCYRTCDDWWKFLFVPAFSIFIACVNQASLRQLPVIIFIAASGYAVTFFINQQVHDSAEFTSAIGAFVIGVLGNVYSRVGHGLAFAAMLPAILVQVPSGIASQGSLVAGIKSADQIVSNGTKPELVTATDAAGTPVATYTATQTPTETTGGGFQSNNNILMLGITMVEVSVGITVGLFVATLVIYPFGKKRSGLFTF